MIKQSLSRKTQGLAKYLAENQGYRPGTLKAFSLESDEPLGKHYFKTAALAIRYLEGRL